ncbi:dihydrofolate reductase [uncultured Clostridium sp.]|uniref:dihydrofolate reductase n=1 Tax=uncultured Clostridium sp. TaxID=59620 RepID=UPI0025EE4C9D|nr:dihydrofolate reductase [uncultured Clostridium sp.]
MLSLIVAIAENNVIGKDNKLIWHISEDLKRFKSITSGNAMFMGRKTFESLPGVLPGRKHIIITRDHKYTIDSEQVSVINDLDSFIRTYENSDDEIFVIGGAEIYKQLLPHCKKLYLTKVHQSFEGDTYFPEIDYSKYDIEYSSDKITDEKSGITYSFINLIRK